MPVNIPTEREPEYGLASKVGEPNCRHAPLQRSVTDVVLDGVTALMRSDTQCSRGLTVEVAAGEHETLVQGVVMVPEQLIELNDLDVVDAGGLENLLGRLGAGISGGSGMQAIFCVG
jgi:hypothetical protein